MRTGRLLAIGVAVLAAVPMAAVPIATVSVPAMAAPAPASCGQPRTDTLDHTPWPLQRLRPQLAWPLSRGQGVRVAVIDSGISPHPKLKGQLAPGKDFVPPNTAGCDNTHGTLVAAIVAGTTNGDPTFHGIAPDAEILPVRVLPNEEKTDDPAVPQRVGDAIRWAADNGADVINLSLQTPPTPYLAASVSYALHKNVVVVAAGGNVEGGRTGTNQPVYPAAYDGVIAVAGVDENDKHVSTSAVGDYIDVAAPGVRIEGPAPAGGGYGQDEGGGTSFAAAYVSGVAALIRGYLPGLAVGEVRRRIVLTADHPADGVDDQVGYGVVNPYRAVATILDSRTTARLGTPSPVPVPRAASDPMAATNRAAGWIAAAGLFVALLVLLVRPVIRRGRARAWRTGPGG